MGLRIARTARGLGMDDAGLALLRRIHDAAMDVRNRLAQDDHEPAYLHPGRSALILLLDLEERDPITVATTMTFDSVSADWAPDDAAVGVPAVLAQRDAVPRAGGDDLAERLVVADESVRRVALAERLDHLRHAHLWTDVEARRSAHTEAVRVYAPVAQRTHPTLARRYAWWCRMFEARHLR